MSATLVREPAAGRVKSADRTLAVLELLARHPAGVTFSEIAHLLSLPRSSTHGLLRTLTEAGWLRSDDGIYRLGVRAWLIGRSAAALDGLVESVREVLARATAETGETAQFVVLDGGMCHYLAIVESPNPMRLFSREGSRLEPHATAVGRAMLAALPEDEAKSILATASLTRFTDHTVVDPNEIWKRISQCRSAGYATESEEYVSGSSCVAAVVGTRTDVGLTCGISITTPTYRRPTNWPTGHLRALQEAVAETRSLLKP